jgi:hypothetical protein
MDFGCNSLNLTFTQEGKPHELSALVATVQIYGLRGVARQAVGVRPPAARAAARAVRLHGR